MRFICLCVLISLFFAGVASAEISLSGTATCVSGPLVPHAGGDACLDVGKNTLAWLYLMASSTADFGDVVMDKDISEFSLSEVADGIHTSPCSYDFLQDCAVAVASHATRPPSYPYVLNYPCDFRIAGYAIPMTEGSEQTGYVNRLHNGTYILRAKARSLCLDPTTSNVLYGIPDLSEDPAETIREVALDNLVVGGTSTRVLIWDGQNPVSIPYTLSDGTSIEATKLTLKVYPMGAGAVESPIHTQEQTIAATGCSYSGSLAWNGSGAEGPGLYTYDIIAEHYQGGYFDTKYANAFGIETDENGDPLEPETQIWDPFLRTSETPSARLLGQFHGTQGVTENQDVLVLDRDTRWDVADSIVSHTTLANTANAVEKLSSPANTYRVSYSLSKQANSCQIVVYGPSSGNNFAVVGQNNGAATSEGSNQADVSLTSADPGDYWFVVVADDNDLYNKAHIHKQAPECGIRLDLSIPNVNVEQAESQPDPTASSEIHFTASFSKPVVDFSGNCLTISGTAGATSAYVRPIDTEGRLYDIAITGMIQPGSVVISMPAGVVHDAVGGVNSASTSTDNSVDYDLTTVPEDVICVNGQTGNDANDGAAWNRAFATLGAALAAADASATRKEVWVADGTYTIPAAGFFGIPAGVKLYGGFTGNELERYLRNWQENETILDGDDSDVIVVSANDGTGSSTIDGFIIQNAVCGINLYQSSLVISNNVIKNTDFGILADTSSPEVVRNLIISNGIGLAGAGSTCSVHENVFDSNEDGAISCDDVDTSSIINNTIVNSGDFGVYAQSSLTIANNIIAFGTGAGISGPAQSPAVLGHNCVYGNNPNYLGISDPGSANGNVSSDPQFVGSGDYHLLLSSSCLDAGLDSAVSGSLDACGAVRVVDIPGKGHDGSDVVDIGAYESALSRVLNVTSNLQDGAYTVGTTVDVRVEFSRPVVVDTTGGLPSIQMNTGMTVRNATYASGSGTDVLVFQYTVGAGDAARDLDYVSPDAFCLNGGVIDGLGPSVPLPPPGCTGSLSANKELVIDTDPPAIVDVTSPNEDNHAYQTGSSLAIELQFSEPVSVTGSWSLNLALAEGRQAVLTSGNGTDTLVFAYTVQSEDLSLDLDYTDSNALTGQGTIVDAAGNHSEYSFLALPIPGSPHSLSYNKNIVVGLIPHSPSLDSAVFCVRAGGVDDGAGTDWDHAFATIEYAISKASSVPAGTSVEIWVAEGEYHGVRVSLPANVSLQGGYWYDTSTAIWKRNAAEHVSRLVGTGEGSVITIPSDGYPSTTGVDGFTICEGVAAWGGGIFCEGVATISHNVLESNTAYLGGGGIHCYAVALIHDNVLAGNYGGEGDYPWDNLYIRGDQVYAYNNTILNGKVRCLDAAWFHNNIIVTHDTPPETVLIAHDADIRNNAIHCDYPIPGITGSNGNIADDPLLDGFHLTWGSPCIDAGEETYLEGETDIDGQPRITNLLGGARALDIGADEYIDENGPDGTVQIAGGADFTGGTNVSLLLAANDAESGVAEMRLSSDGANWNPWVVYSSTAQWTLDPSPDGVKTVYAQFRDVLGNVSELCSDTIVLDTAPPTGGFSILGAPYTNSTSVSLVLSASDSTGSGVAEMRFSNTGQEPDWGTWIPYAASGDWVLTTGDGLKTVYAQFKDAVGNVSTAYTATITLDTTAPAGFVLSANPASSPSNWVKQNVTVLFSTLDSGSDMGHYEVSTDGSSYSTSGVVAPGTMFDDQLDDTNKGAASSVSYQDGYWGEAASCSSADSYISYDATRFPSQGTIGFWIRGTYDGSRGDNTIIDTCGTSSAIDGDLRVNVISGDKLRVQIRSSGSWQSADTTGSINSSSWSYAAVSYGGSGLRIFLGGSLQGTNSCTRTRASRAVVIGDYQGDGSSNAFNGAIDAIRVSSTQSDSGLTALPVNYTMSYVVAQEGEQACWVKAIDKSSNECVKSIQTYIDKTAPTFTNVAASPSPAKNGDTVSITFATEDLPTDPSVKVNNRDAAFYSKSASDNNANYTYRYSVSDSDIGGPATITFSGTDRAGNAGTGSSASALSILGVQWAGTPAVDDAATIKTGWTYSGTFYRSGVEYYDGSAWLAHNLFAISQPDCSDYRLWSMGAGSRKVRVRVFENSSDATGFIAGVTNSITVPDPGTPTLPALTYVDCLSDAQRGMSYTPKY